MPDALVLDVAMPGLDGLAVTRRLRGEGARPPDPAAHGARRARRARRRPRRRRRRLPRQAVRERRARGAAARAAAPQPRRPSSGSRSPTCRSTWARGTARRHGRDDRPDPPRGGAARAPAPASAHAWSPARWRSRRCGAARARPAPTSSTATSPICGASSASRRSSKPSADSASGSAAGEAASRLRARVAAASRPRRSWWPWRSSASPCSRGSTAGSTARSTTPCAPRAVDVARLSASAPARAHRSGRARGPHRRQRAARAGRRPSRADRRPLGRARRPRAPLDRRDRRGAARPARRLRRRPPGRRAAAALRRAARRDRRRPGGRRRGGRRRHHRGHRGHAPTRRGRSSSSAASRPSCRGGRRAPCSPAARCARSRLSPPAPATIERTGDASRRLALPATGDEVGELAATLERHAGLARARARGRAPLRRRRLARAAHAAHRAARQRRRTRGATAPTTPCSRTSTTACGASRGLLDDLLALAREDAAAAPRAELVDLAELARDAAGGDPLGRRPWTRRRAVLVRGERAALERAVGEPRARTRAGTARPTERSRSPCGARRRRALLTVADEGDGLAPGGGRARLRALLARRGRRGTGLRARPRDRARDRRAPRGVGAGRRRPLHARPAGRQGSGRCSRLSQSASVEPVVSRPLPSPSP